MFRIKLIENFDLKEINQTSDLYLKQKFIDHPTITPNLLTVLFSPRQNHNLLILEFVYIHRK